MSMSLTGFSFNTISILFLVVFTVFFGTFSVPALSSFISGSSGNARAVDSLLGFSTGKVGSSVLAVFAASYSSSTATVVEFVSCGGLAESVSHEQRYI